MCNAEYCKRFTNRKVLIPIILAIEILVIVHLLVSLKENEPYTYVLENNSLITVSSDTYSYFYEYRPGVVRNENPDGGAGYSTNIIQDNYLHDRFNYPMAKPEHVYRIMTLGDSYVYGLYVDTKDNASEKLEDLLNNEPLCEQRYSYEVLNLGMPGYDAAYSVERFIKRGALFDPDVVVFYFGNSDFERHREFLLEQFSQDLETDEGGSAAAKQQYEEAVAKMKKQFTSEEIITYQVQAIDRLAEVYEGVILLYGLKTLRYQAWLEEVAGRHDNVFAYQSDMALTPEQLIGGHPTPEGHALIAADWYEYLQRVATVCR